MLNHVREGWRDALAVLLPVDCAGCGAPDRALCAACEALLDVSCIDSLSEHVLVDSTRVVSAVRYEGHVRQLILGFKEQGRTDVAKALARPLRAAIERAAFGSAPGVEVCAVPSSRRSQRRRGYRPVHVLSRAAGFRLSPALSHSALASVSVTVEQKSLDLVQRGLNLKGAFVASPAARGRRFVIVDDVVTSGATILEAARALRSVGAEVVSAATVAFTPRRNWPGRTFSAGARDIHSLDSYGG